MPKIFAELERVAIRHDSAELLRTEKMRSDDNKSNAGGLMDEELMEIQKDDMFGDVTLDWMAKNKR